MNTWNTLGKGPIVNSALVLFTNGNRRLRVRLLRICAPLQAQVLHLLQQYLRRPRLFWWGALLLGIKSATSMVFGSHHAVGSIVIL